MNSTPKPNPLYNLNHSSKTFPNIEKAILSLFKIKYTLDNNFYNTQVINDIVFNSKSHIVASFKNHLILDDESEFLKRYYTKKESDVRLEKFYHFYETFSKIYPNYTCLIEAKFIYKNIHKKQKMIDLQQKPNESHNKQQGNALMHNAMGNNDKKANEVFSTDVYNSILNDNDDIALIFDLKNDNECDGNEGSGNDTANDDNIEKLVNKITLLLQVEERLNVNVNANHKNLMNGNSNSNNNNNSINSSIDYYLRNNVMTPRVASYYPSKIMNRLIPTNNKRLESAKLLSKEESNSQLAINDSTKNIFKQLRNEKSKLSNSSLSSAQRKNNLSTTLSHKKQQGPSSSSLVNNNNNQSNNSNVNNSNNNHNNNANYIRFNSPVACAEDESNTGCTKRHINNNNNNSIMHQSKSKINIRSIKGSETMRLKKNILSHIHDAHNHFLIQSISKINPGMIHLSNKNGNLANSNNNNKESLLSPQITKRNGFSNNSNKECNCIKEATIHSSNTGNNNKTSLSKTKTDRRIDCHNPNHNHIQSNKNKNLIQLIEKSEYIKKKLNNNKSNNNLIRISPCNRRDIFINTTRPKSKSKMSQLNYVNNNNNGSNANKQHRPNSPHNEKNKEIASCNIAIGQQLANSSIKQMIKGIHIKNFSKALGLNDNTTKNSNEPSLRKICTDRIRSSNRKGMNL